MRRDVSQLLAMLAASIALAACRTQLLNGGADMVAGDGCLTTSTMGKSAPALPRFTELPPIGLTDVSLYSAAGGDFDGDGVLDLALTSADSSSLMIVLLGGGAPVVLRVPATANQTGLVARDLNRDHLDDLVVADGGEDSISVLLAVGGGKFGAPSTVAVGRNPWQLVAADLNGDGNVDVAGTNQGDDSVSVLLGMGDGTLMAGDSLSVAGGPRPITVYSATPGAPGLAVGSFADSSLSLLNEHGGSLVRDLQLATGSDPVGVVAADFNGDGLQDLATANSGDESASVFVTCMGRLIPTAPIALSNAPTGVWSADLNLDGTADLVFSNADTASMDVLLGRGDGSFTLVTIHLVAQLTTTVVDLDGDGAPDIAISDGKTLHRFLNTTPH